MFTRLASKLKRGYFPNTSYKKNDVPSVYLKFRVGERETPVKIMVVYLEAALRTLGA